MNKINKLLRIIFFRARNILLLLPSFFLFLFLFVFNEIQTKLSFVAIIVSIQSVIFSISTGCQFLTKINHRGISTFDATKTPNALESQIQFLILGAVFLILSLSIFNYHYSVANVHNTIINHTGVLPGIEKIKTDGILMIGISEVLTSALIIALIIGVVFALYGGKTKYVGIALTTTSLVLLTIQYSMRLKIELPELNITLPEQHRFDSSQCNVPRPILLYIGKVYPFKEASDDLESANSLDKVITELMNKNQTITSVIIVGKADKRNLSIRAQRIFGSNVNLAQARANRIKSMLALRNIFTVVIATAGADFYGENVPIANLAQDRSVEVFITYENTYAK